MDTDADLDSDAEQLSPRAPPLTRSIQLQRFPNIAGIKRSSLPINIPIDSMQSCADPVSSAVPTSSSAVPTSSSAVPTSSSAVPTSSNSNFRRESSKPSVASQVHIDMRDIASGESALFSVPETHDSAHTTPLERHTSTSVSTNASPSFPSEDTVHISLDKARSPNTDEGLIERVHSFHAFDGGSFTDNSAVVDLPRIKYPQRQAQVIGAPLDEDQVAGKPSDQTEATGGTLDEDQVAGKPSDQTEATGGTLDEDRVAGKPSDQTEATGGTLDEDQVAGKP